MEITKELLEEMYLKRNYSIHEIAKIFRCRTAKISQKFDEYHIIRKSGSSRVYISKEQLEDLYINQKKTLKEIGRMFGLSDRSIYDRLRKLGVYKPKIYPSKEILEKLYLIERKTLEEISKIVDLSFITLRKMLIKFCIPKRERLDPPVNSGINPETGKGYSYNRIKTNCKICNKEIERRPCELREHKNSFCSKKCLYEFRSINNSGENNGRFNGAAGQVIQKCENCGKELKRYLNPSQKLNKYNFCDRECLGEFYSGENSPHFINGEYYGYGSGWYRQKALIRKKHKACLLCGKEEEKSGRDLSIHHRIPFRLFYEAQKRDGRNDSSKAHHEDNLMLYCASCHRVMEENARLFWTEDFFSKINIIQTLPSIADKQNFHCYSVYK